MPPDSSFSFSHFATARRHSFRLPAFSEGKLLSEMPDIADFSLLRLPSPSVFAPDFCDYFQEFSLLPLHYAALMPPVFLRLPMIPEIFLSSHAIFTPMPSVSASSPYFRHDADAAGAQH